MTCPLLNAAALIREFDTGSAPVDDFILLQRKQGMIEFATLLSRKTDEFGPGSPYLSFPGMCHDIRTVCDSARLYADSGMKVVRVFGGGVKLDCLLNKHALLLDHQGPDIRFSPKCRMFMVGSTKEAIASFNKTTFPSSTVMTKLWLKLSDLQEWIKTSPSSSSPSLRLLVQLLTVLDLGDL